MARSWGRAFSRTGRSTVAPQHVAHFGGLLASISYHQGGKRIIPPRRIAKNILAADPW